MLPYLSFIVDHEFSSWKLGNHNYLETKLEIYRFLPDVRDTLGVEIAKLRINLLQQVLPLWSLLTLYLIMRKTCSSCIPPLIFKWGKPSKVLSQKQVANIARALVTKRIVIQKPEQINSLKIAPDTPPLILEGDVYDLM